MKTYFRTIFLAASIAPFLASCATQDEVKRLQYQLHVVNKKLEEMKANTVSDIQKRQAASSSQMDQLSQEVLSLKGQLEEAERTNSLLSEKNAQLEQSVGDIAREEAARREEAFQKIQEEQANKDARIAELNDKLKAQEENLQAIQDARVREAERRAKEAQVKADAAKAKAMAASSTSSGTIIAIKPEKQKRVLSAPPATLPAAAPAAKQAETVVAAPSSPTTSKAAEPSVAPKTEVAKPGSPLAEGQSLFDAKQYSGAYDAFAKVAAGGGDKDTVVTASYMMGESLFAQKEYDKAILQFQKIISQHSSHPKAAAATLKQAMAFELLSDNETARMIYKKIVTHYGSSPEAAIAQEKLGKL